MQPRKWESWNPWVNELCFNPALNSNFLSEFRYYQHSGFWAQLSNFFRFQHLKFSGMFSFGEPGNLVFSISEIFKPQIWTSDSEDLLLKKDGRIWSVLFWSNFWYHNLLTGRARPHQRLPHPLAVYWRSFKLNHSLHSDSGELQLPQSISMELHAVQKLCLF